MAEYLLTAISFGFRVRRDALNGYSFAGDGVRIYMEFPTRHRDQWEV